MLYSSAPVAHRARGHRRVTLPRPRPRVTARRGRGHTQTRYIGIRAHETTHACAGRSVSSGQVTGHLNLHTVIHTYREDRRTVDDARSPAKSLPHPTDGDSRLAMYVCTRELPKEGAHARECTKQAPHVRGPNGTCRRSLGATPPNSPAAGSRWPPSTAESRWTWATAMIGSRGPCPSFCCKHPGAL